MFKNENFVDLLFQGGEDGRRDSQTGWQQYVGETVANKTILDVGSGLGKSRARLARNGNKVTLQEPAPELEADIKVEIEHLEDSLYEIVTCFDVIEHIPDDLAFMKNLFRVCKESVFLTTPNFNVFGCKNKYHIREYKPEELIDMCSQFSDNLVLLACNNTQGHRPHIMEKEEFKNTKYPALAVWIKK
jgi:2-polyprenyl-3-methyl-5-hydroxy-6-metoxy-1,4-benzoquinol methylase